jgi:hypothetical protein
MIRRNSRRDHPKWFGVPARLPSSVGAPRPPCRHITKHRTSKLVSHDTTPLEPQRRTVAFDIFRSSGSSATVCHEVGATGRRLQHCSIGMHHVVVSGDMIKLLWFDGDGLCLFVKKLERGRFIWPQAGAGTVSLTRAQLSMLLPPQRHGPVAGDPGLEGIDWRQPQRTWTPEFAV